MSALEALIAVAHSPFAAITTWLLGFAAIIIAIPVVFVLGIWLLPLHFPWFVVWLFFKVFYRVRIHGLENLPKSGPTVLVPNHVSWLDGFLVQLVTPRLVCALVYAGNFKSGWIRRLAGIWKAILISPNPKSIIRALKQASQYVDDGEVVCIFPEGGISRQGQVQTFKAGMTKILKGTKSDEVAVVPMYLNGLWGSIFSFSGGKFFWKRPTLSRRKIDVYYGEPLKKSSSAAEVRNAVLNLGARALEERKQEMVSVSDACIRSCKKRMFRSKMADSLGTDVTGGQALMRALILRRLLKKHVWDADEKHVGLLLPPVVGGVLANMATVLDKRIPVNLNYTVSSDVMNKCIKIAGIKRVLTSRKVMEKFDFDLDAEVVYLDDLKPKLTLIDKLAGAISAYAIPAGILSSMMGLKSVDPDDVLTVIFTSGSTGTPKGVMLTYTNVASNIEAMDQIIGLDPKDVIVGILPFFHSMGFTVTMWAVATLDIKGVYHPNPLESRQVGKLSHKHDGTILVSTPTFLRSYLRRVPAEQFAKLDTVVAGAEKLPPDLCAAFEEKFGVRPVEGYGTTELSPLVSVNVPPSRDRDSHQKTRLEGSVGRCIPGVSAKIVDVDSGEELGADSEGILWIKGPNVMKGYLNDPKKTAEVLVDGWYNTGDMAKVDEDGFIHITGRISRFSKIGGEMVPHIRIEDTLQSFIGMDEEVGPSIAVAAVPDKKKGERLVVLHLPIDKSPSELIAHLKEEGFPNIFIPSEDSFAQIESMPVLGTGKINLKGLKQMALDLFEK